MAASNLTRSVSVKKLKTRGYCFWTSHDCMWTDQFYLMMIIWNISSSWMTVPSQWVIEYLAISGEFPQSKPVMPVTLKRTHTILVACFQGLSLPVLQTETTQFIFCPLSPSAVPVLIFCIAITPDWWEVSVFVMPDLEKFWQLTSSTLSRWPQTGKIHSTAIIFIFFAT